MKNFFTRNRRMVEIILTLALVFLTGGYYYLIYIPARENEIIERRFRTLRRTEENMGEKFQGYLSSIKNCLSKGDEFYLDSIVQGYNKDPQKFRIAVVKNDSIINSSKYVFSVEDSLSLPVRLLPGMNLFESIRTMMNNNIWEEFKVRPTPNAKKLVVYYGWFRLINKIPQKPFIRHIVIEATIDYKEFVVPLLKKNVFDHYLVLNVVKDSSNIIYEDFPSGFSFRNLDSVFDTKEKVYSSRIVKMETGGEKYLAFLHPCGYNNKNDRILVGLLNQKSFDREKRQLPERMVTTILFIALFSFLLLPVIRLALMGKKERIRFVDLFSGYFSFLLLVPVIVLIFFWNNEYFLSDEETGDQSMKVLADEISHNLNADIDSAYQMLSMVDSIYALKSNNDFQDVNIKNVCTAPEINSYVKDTISLKANKSLNQRNRIFNIALKKDIANEYIFWMDSKTGKEQANWSFADNPPRGIYKDRDYFKSVNENSMVLLQSDNSKYYAIEPVISRIDGRFKTVIAKRSIKQGRIVASPCRFRSVMGPVLPLGYSFTVTDSSGKVIFDQDSMHNLNENLVQEFTNSDPLKVALEKKSIVEFTTRYEDDDYHVLVEPMGELPYFVIILENDSRLASLHTQCFSFTMMMMLSFFIFLCLEMTIILLAHYNQSKLLKNKIDFTWIHPQESLSLKYFLLFLFNCGELITLLGICFINFSIERLTEYIFLFMAAAILGTITACIFRTEIVKPSAKRKKQDSIKRKTLFALSALVILVFIGAWKYDVLYNVVCFTAILFLLFIILSLGGHQFSNGSSNNYLVNFRLMIFSKFLIVSGVPVLVLYLCSYHFEHRLQQRLTLLDFAKQAEKHIRDNFPKSNICDLEEQSKLLSNLYGDSGWILNMSLLDAPVLLPQSYGKKDKVCIRLLKTSRVHYNEVSTRTEKFELLSPAGNNSNQFRFNSLLSGKTDTLQYRITQIDSVSSRNCYLCLSGSGKEPFVMPSLNSGSGGFAFWMLLLGSLIFCYQLLKYALDKIFGKNTPDVAMLNASDGTLLSNNKIKYFFVQGIPGSDKGSFIESNLTATGQFTFYKKSDPHASYNARVFSMDEIPDQSDYENERLAFENQKTDDRLKQNWFYKVAELINDRVECIVFSHFEYKILDKHTNRIKLNLIEDLMHTAKKKIIISSDVDPVEYIHSLQNLIEKTPKGNDTSSDSKKTKNADNKQEPDTAFIEYMYRWNNLLGRFTNIYTDNNVAVLEPCDEIGMDEFLHEESSHPVFLKNYKDHLKTTGNWEENEEDYILKIQSLCDHSYRQIWASLTSEEQLALFDLAEDGLMNTTNYLSLMKLLNKGLVIKRDGMLMLMNRSFRNFVLTIINSNEILNIEQEINDGQTWNDYKYPVFIILGALIYFVLSSNPEKFGSVLPVISGVMAGIPTILKLLSYLKPTEGK